jgi:cell wall-associated NlpC family hydrolase
MSRRSLGRVLTGVALASLALFGTAALPVAAGAAPVDDLRARAEQLEQEIATNGAHVAALGEELNAAQLRVDEAQIEIDAADARISETKAEILRLEDLIDLRAAAIYQTGGVATPPALLDVSDATESNVRRKYGEIAAHRDHELVSDLAIAKDDLEAERAAAERARGRATDERDRLAQAKAEADAAAAEQQALLDEVEGELGELVHQQQAARAASSTPASGKSTWSGPAPDPHGGASAAVAFAQAQLGKPYEYAASGPDTYDCSGLTMRAWQAGGLSLPHYSGAQASMFPRVPLDQLAPGDLITTSSWPAHIGIWVGGGYIHATHTGDVIKFVSGSGSVVDAVRPG